MWREAFDSIGADLRRDLGFGDSATVGAHVQKLQFGTTHSPDVVVPVVRRSYDQYAGAWDTEVKVKALGKARQTLDT